MKNSFGSSVILTLFGESHGLGLGAVLDGLAPGITVDEDFIRKSIPAADLLGCIHYNPEIIDADRMGRSPYDFCPAAIEEIRNIKAILDRDEI